MKTTREIFKDYKLRNAAQFILTAKNKDELRESVSGLTFYEVEGMDDLKKAFILKAEELGVEEDKLYSWIEY